MAETPDHLRDLLEKIKGDAQRVLTLGTDRSRTAITRPERPFLWTCDRSLLTNTA